MLSSTLDTAAALPPPSVCINLRVFRSFPTLWHQLSALQRFRIVQISSVPDDTNAECLQILRTPLKQTLVRGLLTLNEELVGQAKLVEEFHTVWHDFFKSLRDEGFEMLGHSTNEQCFWRLKQQEEAEGSSLQARISSATTQSTPGPGSLNASQLTPLPPQQFGSVAMLPGGAHYPAAPQTVIFDPLPVAPAPTTPVIGQINPLERLGGNQLQVPSIPSPHQQLHQHHQHHQHQHQHQQFQQLHYQHQHQHLHQQTLASPQPVVQPMPMQGTVAAAAAALEAWRNSTFQSLIALPTFMGVDPANSNTKFVNPAKCCTQGGMATVFGEHFTRSTKFIFDWPYAAPSGWSRTVTPEAVTPGGAVLRIPPLDCDRGDSNEVKVYIMAEAGESTRGDAQFSYVSGRKETRLMWQSLFTCLYSLDDGIGADIFLRRMLADMDDFDEDDEEDDLRKHFEEREKADRLVPALLFSDVHGRTPVHYMAALALKPVLRYCLESIKSLAEVELVLSQRDLWHLTPVHLAVSFERPSTVAMLLSFATSSLVDILLTATEENNETVYSLAGSNEDVLYELDRAIRGPEAAEAEAARPKKKRRQAGYSGPDINISKVDAEGAICLSD
eukprot:NODE_501_length_2171_cov_29.248351_g459_i0.p1 GENE.NODE_501_length_2171_cov_29.248351_g459_i0~~NODE_501_length_2171_cov_29.248351_g459_i0.p1  ORF type:complete len:614 (-),score=143.31 NODE_501_length_2171_cov_29.248351_g459_i0:194-2035(-)